MLLLPVWEWLDEEVFSLPGVPAGPKPCFNPYQGVDPMVDRPNADRIRRENLQGYLESFTHWPETLVIGEAPGWRGCRFSGVPFTSEAQLSGALQFCGAPSSRGNRPHAEAAATIFWRVMTGYHPRFLAWNCLPLHPYLPGQPLSNRTPVVDEIRDAAEGLSELVALLRPRWVIAVGRSAQFALEHLGLEGAVVRHPGHGGAKAFAAGMRAIFSPNGYPAGLPTQAGKTIDYNSGTFLAPTQDQIPPS